MVFFSILWFGGLPVEIRNTCLTRAQSITEHVYLDKNYNAAFVIRKGPEASADVTGCAYVGR